MGIFRRHGVVVMVLCATLATVSTGCSGDAAPKPEPTADETSAAGDNGKGGDRTPDGSTGPGPGLSLGDDEIRVAKGDAPFTSKRSVVTDPVGDVQSSGESSGLAEIVQASVEGFANHVRLTLVLDAPVPTKMPDESTFMFVQWNLAPTKRYPTAGFTAQASVDGWMVSAAIGSTTKPFKGALTIDGERVILTIPWDFVRGPHRFGWSAASTWSRTAEEQVSYGADNVTNGRFPE